MQGQGRPVNFAHNVSLVACRLRTFVDRKEIVGIEEVGNIIVVYNRKGMYLLEYGKLIEEGRTDCQNCCQHIKASSFLNEN